MSTGELAGLMACAALIGGFVGTLLTLLVVARARSASELRHRRISAYARWIAARANLIRSCVTLVETVQRMRGEPRTSTAIAELAARARESLRAWISAVQEHDEATASLGAWCANSDIERSLHAGGSPGVDARRIATTGTSDEIERWLTELRDLDQSTRHHVRAHMEAGGLLGTRAFWRRAVIELCGLRRPRDNRVSHGKGRTSRNENPTVPTRPR